MTGPRRRRLHLRDLLDEVAAGVVARPGRLVLTTLGTVLGVAALVATVGLAQTASGQVAEHFDAITATHLTVTVATQVDAGTGEQVPVAEMPADADERLLRLRGVESAGTVVPADLGEIRVSAVPVTDPQGATQHALPVLGASPGLFDAVRAELSTGRFFDAGHAQRGDRVALVGVHAAERLHLTGVASQPSVFVGDRAYTVVGIIERVAHRTDLLDAVVLPPSTLAADHRLAGAATLHVRTQLGAVELIGEQAPLALDATRPEAFEPRVPVTPTAMRDRVQADVNALLVVLAGVALLVGGLGIANITLLSVMERVGEIGLRRALGGKRRHIALQFLLESGVIGLLGGLVGSAAGVGVTVGTAIAREWTPLLDPWLAVVAPLVGAVVGLVAGTYPAWKAATIEPIAALRRAT
jgi:putative ABC transport system permease protein